MNVQQIITLAIVAIAAFFVARRLWSAVTSDGSHCSGCGECGKPESTKVRPVPKATPLVSLSTGGAPRRFKPPTPGHAPE